jgi:hypothetical protein
MYIIYVLREEVSFRTVHEPHIHVLPPPLPPAALVAKQVPLSDIGTHMQLMCDSIIRSWLHLFSPQKLVHGDELVLTSICQS